MHRLLLPFALFLSACGDPAAAPDCEPASADSGERSGGPADGDTASDPAADRDGDGYAPADGDCDDTNPDVNPGATEVDWDGLDNDCDGRRGHAAVHLAVGRHHVCALDAGGQAHCWGSNLDGQSSPAAGTFQVLAANATGTCGLDAAGQVTCWGRPFVDPVIDLNTYVQEYHGLTEGVVDLFWMGGTELCGVTAEGRAHCVGSLTAFYGPVGEEGVTGHAAAGNWNLVTSAGELQGLTVGGSYRLSCEGDAGYFGPGDWRQWSDLVDIHGGFEHQCTRSSEGTLDCWGCMDGEVATPPEGAFADSASGDEHACAVDAAGSVTCWGRAGGETRPPDGVQLASVVAGGRLTCGIQTDQEVVCWGDAEAAGAVVP